MRCFDQVEIRYTAGYNPVPADMGYAIVQAGVSYDTGGSGGAVRVERVTGVGSIEYATGEEQYVRVGQLPASAVAVLDRYRRYYA